MDEMGSSEFRRRYASLTKSTLVTVNGHTIGTWIPTEAGWLGPVAEHALRQPGPVIAERHDSLRPFNSRPFTPAPKKGK
jgi:hypothetical protein